jgi:hypothetical protein
MRPTVVVDYEPASVDPLASEGGADPHVNVAPALSVQVTWYRYEQNPTLPAMVTFRSLTS